MKLQNVLAALLALSICGAAPAFAEDRSIISCSWPFGNEAEATSDFLALLQLQNNLSASVEVWAGCFKVTYIDNEGHYVTEFYDPQTKTRIN